MQEQHPCFYPGDFAPPTKMHLNALYWLLNRPEISNVHIVLGSQPTKGITQEQKTELWEMLLKSHFSPQATVHKGKAKGPLSEIYEIFDLKKDKPAYVALHEKGATNKEFQEKFKNFPHYGIQIIPSQFFKSSNKALNAAHNKDVKALKEELPSDFSDDQINNYMSILSKPTDPEAPIDNSPLINYKEVYAKKFNDTFWKSVFEPVNKEY
jgi:hypothetical protein